MNKLFFSLLFLLIYNTAWAQDTSSNFQIIVFPYANVDVGRTSTLALQYRLSRKVSVNAGVRYFTNTAQIYKKIDNEKFRHKFRAASGATKFGASIGLKYDLPWANKLVYPYAYYDLSAFKLDLRFQYVSDSGVNSDVPIPFYNYVYKDLYSLDHSIGLGLTAPLISRVYLNLRAGVSANMVMNLPRSEYTGGTHVNFGYQYAIGLQYNFK